MTEFVEWTKNENLLSLDEMEDDHSNVMVIPLSPMSIALALTGIEMGYRVVSSNPLYLGHTDESNVGLQESFGGDLSVGTVRSISVKTAGHDAVEYVQDGLMIGEFTPSLYMSDLNHDNNSKVETIEINMLIQPANDEEVLVTKSVDVLLVSKGSCTGLDWLTSTGEADISMEMTDIADIVQKIRQHEQFPDHYVTTYREFLEEVEDAIMRLNLEQEMSDLGNGTRGPAGIAAVLKTFEISDSSLRDYLASRE